MKKNIFKRGASAMLAFLMCFTTLVGFGGTTAFAAGTEATAVMIGFPRDGDNNYNGSWGHGNMSFMNGWSASSTSFTLVYGVGSYTGNICYWGVSSPLCKIMEGSGGKIPTGRKNI